MSPADDLARSFRDLCGHLDPPPGGPPGRYDAASVREHLAAFRSLEAAAEGLEAGGGDDEVDRTALLEEIRVAIFRLQDERPQVRNPAFWLVRLAEALDSEGPGRSDGQLLLETLEAVPAHLQAAARTIAAPSEPLVDLAADLVEPVADLVSTRLAGFKRDSE